jgi:hypothetical protein
MANALRRRCTVTRRPLLTTVPALHHPGLSPSHVYLYPSGWLLIRRDRPLRRRARTLSRKKRSGSVHICGLTRRTRDASSRTRSARAPSLKAVVSGGGNWDYGRQQVGPQHLLTRVMALCRAAPLGRVSVASCPAGADAPELEDDLLVVRDEQGPHEGLSAIHNAVWSQIHLRCGSRILESG